VGWIHLVKFLAAFRYVVVNIDLVRSIGYAVDTHDVSTVAFNALFTLRYVFIFNISDMEHQSCGVSISTFHSLCS
jgi:hypothetical protein